MDNLKLTSEEVEKRRAILAAVFGIQPKDIEVENADAALFEMGGNQYHVVTGKVADALAVSGDYSIFRKGVTTPVANPSPYATYQAVGTRTGRMSSSRGFNLPDPQLRLSSYSIGVESPVYPTPTGETVQMPAQAPEITPVAATTNQLMQGVNYLMEYLTVRPNFGLTASETETGPIDAVSSENPDIDF